MEMILVMFIIGLLSVLVVPNLMATLPASRLNADAQRIASFLRQARLKAANTQKPIRISINCINHFTMADRPPCTALMESAVFTDGVMSDWQTIRDGRLEFKPTTNFISGNTPGAPAAGSLLDGNLIWLIYTPSSQIISSFGPPVVISIWYGDNILSGNAYELTLNTASGRVTMTRASH
jgi:type II secretory pathway pseudopilin PulG